LRCWLWLSGGGLPTYRPAYAGAASVMRGAATWPSIGDVVRGWSGTDAVSVTVPETTKQAYEGLLVSLKAAVDKKIGRFDVELPPGLRFGFEEGSMDALRPVPEEVLTPERLAWADREAAAVFMLFFGEPANLCVFFRNKAQLQAAKRGWGNWGDSHLFAFPGKGVAQAFDSPQPATGGMSAPAAKFLDMLAAKDCQTVIAVGPRAKQLRIIDEVNENLSSYARVILVNARIRGAGKRDEVRDRLATAFDPIFHMRFAGKGQQGMLYRALQDADGAAVTPWVVAKRPMPDMPPKEVSRSVDEPSPDQVAAALR